MNDELENYDCLADLRETRKRFTAKYAHDPVALFKHLDTVPERFFNSLGIRNEWVK
jgi:hypothetical protein